jgi:membrane protein
MFDAVRSMGRFIWKVVSDFMEDDCPQMAAAISYYTIFAVPPLLGVLALGASLFVDPESVRELVSRQVAEVVGVESAAQIVDVVERAEPLALDGVTAIVGLLAILFAVTGAFLHLQSALNRAWRVAPDPEGSSIRRFLVKRGLSMAMLACTGLLLLASMLLSTALSVFEDVVRRYAPAWLGPATLQAADWTSSFLVFALLFMLIFRYVPDAVVRWSDAAVGAAFTAALFSVGTQLIGFYLGQSNPGSVYGAAGSLAIALLWVYYSAMILLLGAEFTEVWSTRGGSAVTPEDGAVRVRRTFETTST